MGLVSADTSILYSMVTAKNLLIREVMIIRIREGTSPCVWLNIRFPRTIFETLASSIEKEASPF